VNEMPAGYVVVSELERLLTEDGTITLIDARTPEEFTEGHVPALRLRLLDVEIPCESNVAIQRILIRVLDDSLLQLFAPATRSKSGTS